MQSSRISQIEDLLPQLILFRRDLHRHPELSMEEFRTSEKIMDILSAYNVECKYINNHRGVKAAITGALDGDDILLRADIDALPITEHSGCGFESEVNGVMHACGHDMHATWLVGAAILLERNKETLRGRIICIFQCGEETSEGALEAINSGALRGFKPRYLFAFHTEPQVRSGSISIKSGNSMTGNATLKIVVKGKGGHGAYPHLTVDPILIASEIIGNLQRLSLKCHHPADPVVITITAINGGSTFNVTPDEVVMQGTVRFFKKEIGEQLKQLVCMTCEETARLQNGECIVEYRDEMPPIVTSQGIYNYAKQQLNRIENATIVSQDYPNMGSEDFGAFSTFGPLMVIRIGTQNDDVCSSLPLHNAHIIFDETSIITGIKAICAIAGLYVK